MSCMKKIKDFGLKKDLSFFKSIDFFILLLLLWRLICHYHHGDYTCLMDYISDIKLRKSLLFFFYYSVSRLFFHYYRDFFYYFTIAILLFITIRESYLCVMQIAHGVKSPVGSLLNPGIVGGFLSIAFSVVFVEIHKIQNRCWRNCSLFLLCPLLVIIALTKSRVSILALISSILCFYTMSPRYAIVVKKNLMIIAVCLFALFTFLYFVKKPSADGRIYMSKIALMSIFHNEVWGSGTDSYSVRFGEEQLRYNVGNCDKLNLNLIIDNDFKKAKYACAPMTSFNEFLRLGVEYGYISLLLSLLIVIKAILILLRERNSLGYGLLALFIFSLFSYPLSYSVFCLLSPLFIGFASCIEKQSQDTKWFNVSIFRNYIDIILLGSLLYSEVPQKNIIEKQIKNEGNVQFLFKNEDYRSLCDYCETFIDERFSSINMLYWYGVSLSMIGKYENSDTILHLGASKCCDPLFWQEIGHNFCRCNNFEEAEQSYIRAFLMMPNRITPLFHLARLYHIFGEKEKLDRVAEYVDTFVPKIPSTTTKEYREKIIELAKDY